MRLQGTARGRFRHGIVAIAAASATTLHAERARAADAGTGPTETTCTVLSVALPPTTVLIWAFVNADPNQDAHVAGGVLLIAGGAAGVILGATAIGLQTGLPGYCDGDCRETYGVSALGVALGAAVVTLGAFRAAGRLPIGRPSTPNYLYFAPRPLLIPTPRGPVVGVGVGGVTF